MADHAPLYPPTPRNVPHDLTKPTPAYRQQVLLVLACLIAFLIVYAGLLLGSAFVCYRCVTRTIYPNSTTVPVVVRDARGRLTGRVEPAGRDTPLIVLIPGAVFSGMLCLFLGKGLFKHARRDAGIRFEVTERDQPDLFEFIYRLCEDTDAPLPHRVFLYPEVTAAVSFDESLLNLIIPSRKNLHIGLGLVNRLNLTEFKAVLAHEFGHFSQNGMRVGRYVYTANRLMAEVVYGRDWFDDMIAEGCKKEFYISAFAWAFFGVMWVIRQGLQLLFRGINFANVALSRQMEYNADLVAVSVTGSDPLIFALARLDFAADALNQAWGDLMAAADHDRFSRDVYHHQTHAAEYLRVKRGDVMLGEVPPLPADRTKSVRVFRPEDTSVPAMWATHPSNYDREENAKARYFRGPTDDCPAWVLFRNPAGVKKRMTFEAYMANRNGRVGDLEDPEAVQAFIDAEHAETTHPPQYHGLYENRYIKPGTLEELTSASARAEFADHVKLAAAHAALSGEELRERMDAHRQRREEANRLAGISGGHVELTGEDFKYRGRRYGQTDARRLLGRVERAIEMDFVWMHRHDRTAFRVHYAMACQLGETPRVELRERYAFHFALQGLHAALGKMSADIRETMNELVTAKQLTDRMLRRAIRQLKDTRDTFQRHLKLADGLHMPPLVNMEAVTRLGQYLFGEKLVRSLSRNADRLEVKWVVELLAQMSEAMDRAARILFKSMGAILTLQDRLAAEWYDRRANPPAADTVAELADPAPAAVDAPDHPAPSPERNRRR